MSSEEKAIGIIFDHGRLRSKSGPGMNDTFIHFSLWIFVVVKTARDRNTRYCKIRVYMNFFESVFFFLEISKHCENGNIFIFCLLFLDLQGPWKCRRKKNLCRFSLLISRWLPLLNYFYLIPLFSYSPCRSLQSFKAKLRVTLSVKLSLGTLAESPCLYWSSSKIVVQSVVTGLVASVTPGHLL